MKRLFLLAALVVGLATTAVPQASAEWFADLYFGGGRTNSEDKGTLTLSGLGISVSATETIDVRNSSYTAGGRFGYWFEGLPWLGAAFDASWFKPSETAYTVPLSLLLMLRYGLLTSPQFPSGQLQPYFGIGPGIFITRLKNVPAGVDVEGSTDLGLDLRTGLAWLFARNWAIFAEYRFAHFRPEFTSTQTVNILGIPFTETLKEEVTANSHFGILGISFRFNMTGMGR